MGKTRSPYYRLTDIRPCRATIPVLQTSAPNRTAHSNLKASPISHTAAHTTKWPHTASPPLVANHPKELIFVVWLLAGL